ncbi:CBS domain-containing protein [Clostridium luticellarii]|jgi:CBS domain-containing protein|uniref:Inosine-5'-monophosphate dehydrogenase n=1 Tax=Clostridium luticellarii TaxID=1691940 RepID=A0A2T0BDJ7_9CLOT|nr:CBS domain-containing protein [Clostridium luticellarii]MCI1945120.1 CBS domain-containing protein [Clostridium luticellarii]MCI1968613.1 CBS domain-containing protein [Clostridium luticellarii]MCI1995917.1 CBS domain-containing protein [Clostridium luticellarii]MCI2040982.1 CBS domain-containing protein [Clostridium luticellarii]PRR81969.1 Inosine-5'-monophosphate dehydrogenase [Clostridium luticellarii]
MPVKEIMRSRIVKLNKEDSLCKALKVMDDHGINGAPVVDESGKLVGMIVKADIYRFLMEEGHYDTCPVDWAMTKNVITAHGNEDIFAVARRLREKNIIAIPVIDDKNIVEGIVSIEDIMDYAIKKSPNA